MLRVIWTDREKGEQKILHNSWQPQKMKSVTGHFVGSEPFDKKSGCTGSKIPNSCSALKPYPITLTGGLAPMMCRLTAQSRPQRAQYCLVKEFSLNHMGILSVI